VSPDRVHGQLSAPGIKRVVDREIARLPGRLAYNAERELYLPRVEAMQKKRSDKA
jgi:hypothetical protein